MKLFVNSVFIIFFILAISHSHSAPHDNGVHSSKACLTDPSKAALDIVLVIDVSANNGPTKVSQITALTKSILSKFTISSDKNYTLSNPTSRVGIITYSDNITITANITSLNSYQDVSNTLSSIVGSTSDWGADYASAIDHLFLYNAILDPSNVRPPVLLTFASATKTQNVLDRKYMTYTMITVNYNIGNNAVASFLTQIANPGMAFRSSSPTLEQDILNSILQATC
uniref:VWFA domain-containing protein n=1 Tax=Acrobeloides nanus TaxID=290746 RepID=A0A914DLY8_9BILA